MIGAQFYIISFQDKGYYGGTKQGKIRYVKNKLQAKRVFNYENAESLRQRLFVLTGIRTLVCIENET